MPSFIPFLHSMAGHEIATSQFSSPTLYYLHESEGEPAPRSSTVRVDLLICRPLLYVELNYNQLRKGKNFYFLLIL